MFKYISVFLIILFLIPSCVPDEIPFVSNNLFYTTQIDLGSDYCYQKYYDIDNDLITGDNLITDWDLAFSSKSNSIILNSSKYMRVVAFNPSTILDLNDLIQNTEWNYDNPSGDVNLLALNNGSASLYIGSFLVDKGYDCDDNHLGYVILEILDYDINRYVFRVIDIYSDGSWDYNESIELQKTENDYIHFSLDTKSIVDLITFEWDLCFSQYTEFNVSPPTGNNAAPLPTYQVVGVLQNNHVSVAVDSLNSFDNISIENITNYLFELDRNTIGYNWKKYNLQMGLYSIESPVYIIKISDYDYYKLLFLDFYNDNGEKGAPMFKVSKL